MAIEALYRARCQGCGLLDTVPLASTAHEAVALVVARGWSAYPLMCAACRLEKERR